jgi:tRNA nucleotidyltransferase (CCA-adding enzyme)
VNMDSVLARIKPSEKERGREGKVIDRVLDILGGYPVEPILVGSLAKDTDLAGNKDIDIFIQFSETVSREELEREGLRMGREVFKNLGVEHEIDYAEHPYVKGVFEGHSIEVVPCYKGKKVMSAVDRTPHHVRYVKAKLEGAGLNAEVRLLKQFMDGIGVYGAEAKVEGFSGYLVELLVIHYGSFNKVLEAGRGWSVPQVLDPEGLWDNPGDLPHFFTNASLIVVDPVDKSRNVAAAVSPGCLAKFMVKSDEYIRKPSEEYFFPKEKPMRELGELKEALLERGSKFIVLVFKHGKLNVNTLYAQLRKTSRQVAGEFDDREFTVFRSSFWTNEADTSIVLLELGVWELPEMMHHLGPPVTQPAVHQERFTQKYSDDRPYVKDGRWVVDTKRKYRVVVDLIPELVSEKRGFGKNLREMDEPQVLYDDGLFSIGDEGFLKFLNEYLD